LTGCICLSDSIRVHSQPKQCEDDQCDAHVHFNLKVARSLMAPLPLRDDPLEIVFTRYGEQVDASIVNAFDQAHT
jgi:hypothetical protein